MTRRQRLAFSLWLGVCVVVSLVAVLSLLTVPSAGASLQEPATTPRWQIDATATLTDSLAAILAAEILLDPGLANTYLPAVMR